MRFSIFRKFLLALVLGLVTVFVIDPLDPTTISTPFCLSIILMALSLRQSISLVVAVSLIYIGLVLFSLIHFQQNYIAHVHAVPHPHFWLFQREGLFLVVCTMAIHLAYYRTDTERILARLRSTLGKLPAPVILSDSSGNIVYANDAVTAILHQTPSQLTGKSYFNILLMEKVKGKSIRSYFDLFDAGTNATQELEISPFDQENRMTAQIICLGTGSNRVMITVLLNSEKMPGQSAAGSHEASLPANFDPQPQKL